MQAKLWEPSVTRELIAASQQGDMPARERLVAENTPLVRSLVKRFTGRGADYDDLYQMGQMGLLKAIAGFDSSYNVLFSTYAVPVILGELKRFLRDSTPLKLSRSAKENFVCLCGAQERLRGVLGREPSLDEAAAEANLDREQALYALQGMQQPASLDEPLQETEKPLADTIAHRENGLSVSDRLALQQCLAEMPPRERAIILLRYFRGCTQAAIAEKLGISQVQVSRIEAKVLSLLREKLDAV